jgi:solute carrier family 35, member E3
VRKLQQERRVKPSQLLGITAPAQAGLLLLCGPFVDFTLNSRWIGDYTWTPPIAGATLASCLLALGVNFSQVMHWQQLAMCGYFCSRPAAIFSCTSLPPVSPSATQYLCLGKFQAITFQVMGHAKTVLIVAGGWLFFQDTMSPQTPVCASIAIAGLLWYAKATSPKPAQPALVVRS